MPTAIDQHRLKTSVGTLQTEGGVKGISSVTAAATNVRIRGSRNVGKNQSANQGNNNTRNSKSTMMPKVFGNFRTNHVSSIVSSSNHNKQPQAPVPTPTPAQNTILKTPSSGDISNTTASGSNGWSRHYNHSSDNTKTIGTTCHDDDLNNTDDTEDSSHSGMAAHSPEDNNDNLHFPIITESSYVYPTTTTSSNSSYLANHNQPSTDSNDKNQNDLNNMEDELPNNHTSSSNVNASSTASTKAVHKPVTEMLWESAEPFIAYSSAQGAKWCIGMNQLSSVLEETCTGRSPKQHDYDDTFAIVGTQDEEDEVVHGNDKNGASTSSPFNIDISNLCGTEISVPNFTTETPCGQQQPRHDKEIPLLDTANDINKNNLKNRSAARRIVISRTHEDIEVSPGHHVQVRLPPTNPIMKSSSILTTAEAVQSPTRSSHATPANIEALQNNTNTSSDLPSSPVLQRSYIVKNNSSDSCKAVPLKPNEVVADPIHDNVPNSDLDAAITQEDTGTMPVVSFEVRPEEALELERSISELTMRSSYAATDSALQKIPENRRMAYYAVGKHHRQSGRGGNRRCYFSGKLILGGTPFYAGSVLQGLRTLVVFCLPSSIGLPEKESLMLLNLPRQPQQSLTNRSDSHSTGTNTLRGLRLLKSATNGSGSKQSSPSYISHYTQHSNNLGAGASHAGSTIKSSGILSNRSSNRSLQQNQHRSTIGNNSNSNNFNSGASTAGSKSMMSKLSSLDDLSLSVEGDLDPNWSLDRDMLLKILPPASPDILKAMSTLYPEQFETLPVQVRDAKQWKLYVKFCFFSGLPISDGEMHYKVRDDIAEQVYGEEIVLSHDVMEASTGASAEILTLPNRTVMRYLRKHYAQQCSKLDDRVFQRASWERVAPEV